MEENINKLFGNRLSELRKEKRLSQESYALKYGFDRSYIGILERGEKSPTLNTINKIAKSFNLSISELLKF